MVVDTKLYDILGASPTANERELKKAFMLKARESHPDKNQGDPNATEKFQQINEAYEILKDPHKREVYDKYGPDGLREGGGGGGGFDDIMSHIFGGRGGGRSQRRQRTQDIGHKISVSLEDLYNGKEVTLKINRDVLCSDCNGTGVAGGKAAKKCTDCNGSGQRVQVVRMGPMITQQVGVCPTCRGCGEMIDAKDKCKKCSGKKVVSEGKKVTVHIEPGMSDGEKIVFQGCSDEAPNAETGDLVVMLSQKKHDRFLRKHDDLLIAKRITLTEALLGTSFVVKHLDGRQLVVKSTPDQVIVPDAVKVIDREGMPQRRNVYSKGRLFVKFEIIFPKGDEVAALLKDALLASLPPPDHCAGINETDENVYKVAMKDSDLKQFEDAQRSHDNRREAYGRDDHESGGQSASCQPM